MSTITRPRTMAEAEAMPASPFDKYQSDRTRPPRPPRGDLPMVDPCGTPISRTKAKKNAERVRQGKDPLIDTRNMPREVRNAIPVNQRMTHRGLARRWEDRIFKAKFQGFSYQWFPETCERVCFINLTDVWMDGALLTMNWRMPEVQGLMNFCKEPGAVIEFQCWFARTGIEAKLAGQPVLRGPFRKVAP